MLRRCGQRGSSSTRSTPTPWPGSGTELSSPSCSTAFARVSAVLGMRRQDYFGQGSRGWLRLHEKGGRRHDVPAHHRAAAALDEYLEAAELEEPRAVLFQSVDPAASSCPSTCRASASSRPAACCSSSFKPSRTTSNFSFGRVSSSSACCASSTRCSTCRIRLRAVSFHGAKPNPYAKYLSPGNLLIYGCVVSHVIAHSAELGPTPQRPPKGRCTVARRAVSSTAGTPKTCRPADA